MQIDLTEPVSLTFSLKYLTNFCKASGLSDTVKLCLSSEVPLLVEYGLSNNSYLRFYLAPKVRHHVSVQRVACANVTRLATRSDYITDLSGTSDMFSGPLGDHRRNAFDGHRQRLFGYHVRRVELGKDAGVPRISRKTKEGSCPTRLFHVIARGALR